MTPLACVTPLLIFYNIFKRGVCPLAPVTPPSPIKCPLLPCSTGGFIHAGTMWRWMDEVEDMMLRRDLLEEVSGVGHAVLVGGGGWTRWRI